MKNTLKNLGILLTTGAAAVVGMFLGTIAFRPESVTISSNETKKEEAE